MVLTIITINRNNVSGLKKTMQSVLEQAFKDFEYVVVDGASTDGSVEVIEEFEPAFGDRLRWISESDKGIYHAMNKGIRMASGDYVEFLNSGDCLASSDVVGRMMEVLAKEQFPPILYGNMIKVFPDGHNFKDCCFAGRDISFLGFYTGTLNHSPAFIKRSLFDRFGMYDESLRIVSDWKWYLQTIVLGGVKPVYSDIDVTVFDMTGISETNKELEQAERKKVLSELIPASILSDYDNFSTSIDQVKRLKRHPWAYRIVWFLERSLFKIEKWRIKRTKFSQYR